VQAITIGRAPRSGRGRRARQWLAARLPGPTGLGLGLPFARPARSAATVLAILLGATTVVFATGLSASLSQATAAFTRAGAVPVEVEMAETPSAPGLAETAAVRRIIQSRPGTARLVGARDIGIRTPGLSQSALLTGYDADASWTGFALVSGRWYAGPDEIVAGSRLLRSIGRAVGDTLTISGEQGTREVRIVGEAFDDTHDGLAIVGPIATLSGLTARTWPDRFEIALDQTTDPGAYLRTLAGALTGHPASAEPRRDQDTTVVLMLSLIATLTVLLVAVAALGVFTTVVLNTYERIHQFGVLKSIGTTPGQIRAVVVLSMIGIGLPAGILAVPVGYTLHRTIVALMADIAGTGIPASVLDVYSPAHLAALSTGGVLVAFLGALVPAGWAAHMHVATALRAE
ncbi:ABC transporter permease, partial [Acrocarpospora macrocephala]